MRSKLINLKYVYAQTIRKNGLVYNYHRFRRPGYPVAVLPGLPGSPEFMAAYHAARAGAPLPAAPIGASRSKPGSLAALIAAYLEKGILELGAEGTRRQRRAIVQRFRDQHGDKPVAQMNRKFVDALVLDLRIENSPHVANNWLKTIRHLMEYARRLGYCETNPCEGVKCKVPTSEGHVCWMEDQIAQFETFHPIGSRARLAFALAIYTGQRRQDIVRMGRQSIKNGVMTVRQLKRTGGRAEGVTVQIPMHPQLVEIIAASNVSDRMIFLLTDTGRQYAEEYFTNWFAGECAKAGLPKGLTVHGLRKAFCVRMVHAGCQPHEIAALSGHLTLKEIERYTKAYNKERAGAAGMAKLIANEEQKSIKKC
jgi:integrase